MRVALLIEYAGTAYQGWQAQASGLTVQGVVEAALSFVAAAPVRVVVAGRTDTGVHALGQVVHFDAPVARPVSAWVLGGNAKLPPDVRILGGAEVVPGFHARFGALARHYRYLVLNRPQRSALWAQRAAWERRTLDVGSINAAARHLLGEHDFSAFRAAGCQAHSPVRALTRLEAVAQGPWLTLDVEGNAFLLHMVRNLAGTLLEIGAGAQPPDFAAQLLAGRDRRLAPPTAPACGLYLYKVHYPLGHALPEVAAAWPPQA